MHSGRCQTMRLQQIIDAAHMRRHACGALPVLPQGLLLLSLPMQATWELLQMVHVTTIALVRRKNVHARRPWQSSMRLTSMWCMILPSSRPECIRLPAHVSEESCRDARCHIRTVSRPPRAMPSSTPCKSGLVTALVEACCHYAKLQAF